MTPAQVAAMIAAKGQTVTVTGRVTGAYNPATGTGTDTTNTKTASAVPLPLAGYRKVGENNVAPGDETLLLAAVDTAAAAFRPKVGSTVTLADGSTKFTLIAIDTLAPAGTDLYHDCVVRRAA